MTEGCETGPPRLAVVDDEAEFRAVVRRVAQPIGWMVSEYANGRELVRGLETGPQPDLILLDLVMPELDGIEAIGWIAATWPSCPVILVTGRLPIYSDIASTLGDERGLRIIETLRKPLSVARLREALNPDRLRQAAPSARP